jgi:hypothetical protein
MRKLHVVNADPRRAHAGFVVGDSHEPRVQARASAEPPLARQKRSVPDLRVPHPTNTRSNRNP